MCFPSFKPGVFYVFVHICALWIRRRPVDSLNPTQSELDIEIKKEKRGGKKKKSMLEQNRDYAKECHIFMAKQ